MSRYREFPSLLASIISDHHPVQGEAVDIAYRDLVDDIANYFESVDSGFDREGFIRACGYGWREATPDERFRYLAGYKETLPLEYRETEHGLEVREK